MSSTLLSVGIDVGSAFSFMSIVDSSHNLVGKSFKILHEDSDSLDRAVFAIKKAEELKFQKAHIFLESTGIYHIPLFCYLSEKGFDVSIINPLITHSIKNAGIRKVKNDRLDSIGIAKLGLSPDLRTSKLPVRLVLDLRYLTRRYFDLVDERAAHFIKLKGFLHVVFPQYLSIFSNITGKTSLMMLEKYGSPQKLLRAHKESLIGKIMQVSRKGRTRAANIYDDLIAAAKAALTFSCQVDSVYFAIQQSLKIFKELNTHIADIVEQLHAVVDANSNETFIKQISLADSIPGIGFLSSVALMCELGDFSIFHRPKQLFAYFGMDPAVKESGKFKVTNVHMSKRGSCIARRVIFAVALSCIRRTRNGQAIHPYLLEYYKKKTASKPKMVAIGAVMHKICNIIFAVLRDQKPFEFQSPEQHRNLYVPPTRLVPVA